KQRMSKTVGNVVGVTDDSEVIRKQVLSMVTDIKRPRRTDPGHPRSCNVCAFYKFFFDDWEHYWDLCRRAQIGCFDKKKLLAETSHPTNLPGLVAGVPDDRDCDHRAGPHPRLLLARPAERTEEGPHQRRPADARRPAAGRRRGQIRRPSEPELGVHHGRRWRR